MKKLIKTPMSFISLLLVALISGCWAFTIYLLFLQPSYVISKSRLILALGLWTSLAVINYLIFRLDVFSFRSLKLRIKLVGLVLSVVLSLWLLLAGIGIGRLPYNLLILPERNLEIQLINQAGNPKVVELVEFNSGLGSISFSAFQTEGSWERTDDSLRVVTNTSASLQYKGWLVDRSYLIFVNQPDGGRVRIIRDGESIEADLSSPVTQEQKISMNLEPEFINKITTLSFMAIALFALIYPFMLMLINKILSINFRKFSIDKWFDDFSLQLQGLTGMVVIFSLLLFVLTLISPTFTKDHQSHKVSIQPSSEQPNIILIIVDALTAEDMSLYGYSLPTTPNLERITNEWNVYLNAYTAETSSTGMLPTIMTGRYPYLSYPYGRYGNLIRNSSDWVSLFQLLSTAGYQTYWQGYKTPGFYHSGNGFHRFIQPSWKQAFWKSWFQFDSIVRKTYPYVPYSLKLLWALLDKLGTGYAFYETEWLGNMFENHEFQAPFFIYLHYSGAHGVPYQAGEFLGTFLPVSEGLTDKQSQSALYGKYPLERQAEVDKLRLRYDEAILNQDAKLDQLIQVIKDTGWYDSSMIIITADHGQVFNNGYSSHCTPLLSYAESHVPLLIKFPYQEEGRVLSSLVSSVDLAPTILDVCGIQNEKKWFDGLSLLGELPVDRYVFVRDSYSRARNFGLITSQYKFSLRNQDYYLYDYLKDPLEKHNLFSDQSIDRELVQRMTNEINVFISKIREQEYIF